MPPNSRLIVIEALNPGRNEPSFHKFMDLNMFVMTGGRERTADEYGALFDRAGFDLARTTSTPTEIAVLEAVPRAGAS